jgi:hypothetical protein
MKSFHSSVLFSLAVYLFLGGCSSSDKGKPSKQDNNYFVAAYVWPSMQDEKRSREVFWEEGIGEWEVIKKNTPRFEGHHQPRIPLWGYQMDDDPKAVEKKIEAALQHGVNMFIYDWYWFDGEPFLEEALNDGFLKASNNEKMHFYIMWANHDVPGKLWNPYKYKTDTTIWTGKTDRKNFEIIVDRVINKYFNQPNYFKIKDEPVFSIYDLKLFIESFDGIEGSQSALEYFRDEVKKAGFPGLHIQVIGKYDQVNPANPVLFNSNFLEDIQIDEFISLLGINSVTMYNMAPKGDIQDYLVYGERGIALRENWDSILDVPFFPVVSAGWDNTPRYLDMGKESVIHLHNTPQSFATYLQKAKEYVDHQNDQPPLIIINAWNEWVEGSYLEPDMLHGYGYLEAVRDVMNGKY